MRLLRLLRQLDKGQKASILFKEVFITTHATVIAVCTRPSDEAEH